MFNPNITRQAQEVIFTLRKMKYFHSKIFFNEISVECTASPKDYLYLDQNFDFNKHINL